MSDPSSPPPLQPTLDKLSRHEDLTEEQASASLRAILSGGATDAQIGAFLLGLRVKGETVDEITGLARAMRSMAIRVETDRAPLLDTCGTGGDGAQTFNISTAAAFVAAGAGAVVAKHGNRSVSSRCGSADVLERLGVTIDLGPDDARRCLEEVGIAFLLAPLYHEATHRVAVLRRELGVRTVFNLLGPLTNPAGAPHQLVGVFDAAWTDVLATALARLGTRRALVVSGLGGLDELSLSGPTRISEVAGGRVTTREITPESLGFLPVPKEAIRGGETDENARLLRAVLEGEAGPHRDVVLLNAAAALVAAELAASLPEGLQLAAGSIDSGEALRRLEGLVDLGRNLERSRRRGGSA